MATLWKNLLYTSGRRFKIHSSTQTFVCLLLPLSRIIDSDVGWKKGTISTLLTGEKALRKRNFWGKSNGWSRGEKEKNSARPEKGECERSDTRDRAGLKKDSGHQPEKGQLKSF